MIAGSRKPTVPCPPDRHADRARPSGSPPATLVQRKSQWRQRIAQRLRRLSPAEWQAAGAQVAANIESIAAWQQAHRIAVYLHTAHEVPTTQLIDICRKRSCAIYLPVYDQGRRQYVPAAWQTNDRLHRGVHGILEPVNPQWAPDVGLDLILVPGRAFTKKGIRLGRGGGYYDRFLSAPWAGHAVKVGLALEYQLVDDSLADTHDVGMDWIVTEKRMYAGAASAAATTWRTDRHKPKINECNLDALAASGKE